MGVIDIGTFGSVTKYKSLKFLTEKISSLEKHKREYISSVISDFNEVIKKSEQIKDLQYKNYILELIEKDFISRTDNHLVGKFDDGIVSRFKNFIKAKIRNAKRELI